MSIVSPDIPCGQKEKGRMRNEYCVPRYPLKKTDPKKFADLPSSHRMLETKLYELGVK